MSQQSIVLPAVGLDDKNANPFFPLSWRRFRMAMLVRLFRLFIGTAVFSESSKSLFETIILDDDLELISAKQEHILASVEESALTRFGLRLYFFYHRNNQSPIHLDVAKYILFWLHRLTGPLDPSLESNVDDQIQMRYDPVRRGLAHEQTLKDLQDSEDTVLSVPLGYRMARYVPTIKDVTSDIFHGVSRPIDPRSEFEIVSLYDDTKLQRSHARASKETEAGIRTGKIAIIALSYRHKKDSTNEMGISRPEFVAAVGMLPKLVLEGMEESMLQFKFCIWWDSILKCSGSDSWKKLQSGECNWAAIGLAPYAFCHTLSIRRQGEEESAPRLWIDEERVMARFGRAMSAVLVECQEGETVASVLGFAEGDLSDPEHTLREGLRYAASGDLHNCEVTFEQDKVLLEAAALKLLCEPSGLGVVRALYGDHHRIIKGVSQLSFVEREAFLLVVKARMGTDQVEFGGGEPFFDEAVDMQENGVAFYDRKNWLPNSIIYSLQCQDNALPKHVENQVVFRVHGDEKSQVFGLLLYHQVDDEPQVAPAVHGCVVNFVQAATNVPCSESVSRLHIPKDCDFYKGFVLMCNMRKQTNADIRCPVHAQELNEETLVGLKWLWAENEMEGNVDSVERMVPS